jgi:hypothetical protein
MRTHAYDGRKRRIWFHKLSGGRVCSHQQERPERNRAHGIWNASALPHGPNDSPRLYLLRFSVTSPVSSWCNVSSPEEQRRVRLGLLWLGCRQCSLRVVVEGVCVTSWSRRIVQKSRPNKVHCVASHAFSFSVVSVSDKAGFDRRTLNRVAALTFDRVGAEDAAAAVAWTFGGNRTRAIGRPNRIRPFFHSR